MCTHVHMYRCPCAPRVPIHRLMCIDAHTCIHICKRVFVYIHVHVHQCMCASISMCLHGCLHAHVCGVCIYRCTYVYIYTHRHTRTYPDGNTHPCVCVCVCLSVGRSCARTRPYIRGKHKHIAKGAFLSNTDQGVRHLNLQKGNNPR